MFLIFVFFMFREFFVFVVVENINNNIFFFLNLIYGENKSNGLGLCISELRYS